MNCSILLPRSLRRRSVVNNLDDRLLDEETIRICPLARKRLTRPKQRRSVHVAAFRWRVPGMAMTMSRLRSRQLSIVELFVASVIGAPVTASFSHER